jgi:hypothetical protein
VRAERVVRVHRHAEAHVCVAEVATALSEMSGTDFEDGVEDEQIVHRLPLESSERANSASQWSG